MIVIDVILIVGALAIIWILYQCMEWLDRL